MRDLTPTITNALETATGLTPLYELFLDSDASLPAITYQEYNSYDVATGDNITYYIQQYMIKVWCTDLSELATYKAKIDKCMKDMKFQRVSYGELTNDNEICSLMLYEGQVKEGIEDKETIDRNQ